MKIDNGVTLYTKEFCKQCERTKRRLAANGVEYQEQIIDTHVLEWAKSEGIRQAPILTVNTGKTEYVGSGYDEYGIDFAIHHFGDIYG